MSATTSSAAAERSHLGFIISGIASLFIISFLDNSRGPILPVLCKKLSIPYETAGTFLTLGCVAAVIATYYMGVLLRRYNERSVALGTAAFSIIPGLMAPFINSVALLLVFGAMVGASVSLIGTMCNILTIKGSTEAQRAKNLSFQQIMYGLGSLLGPLVFSELVRRGIDWSWMLVGCSVAIAGLGVAYAILLPKEKASVKELTPEAAKMSPKALAMVALFAIYVGGEVLTSMWMSTLLVGKQGQSPAAAAIYGMRFFAFMAGSRFLCFLFAKPKWEEAILYGCLISGVVFGILGQQGQSWALPLMGLLGPFVPLFMAKVSRDFPEHWKAMTVYLFVGVQGMLAIMHQTVGKIADALGIENAFLLAPLCLLITIVMLYFSTKKPGPREA